MRALIATLALFLSLGCATTLSPGQQAAEVDVATRVIVRVLELVDDPVATPETCEADANLLVDLAKVIADRIDGGEASGSSTWLLFDRLAGILTSAGCEFVPERDPGAGAGGPAGEDPLMGAASHLSRSSNDCRTPWRIETAQQRGRV